MQQRFRILVSQVCLCLMRNFSPPTHPSSIFLYLHPLHTCTRPSCPSRWSRPVEDLPSEEAAGVSAQMFLSAKGAPSLEHQRGEIVKHSRGKYLWQRDELLAGDSSLANVTLRDEEVAKKHNCIYSFYDLKTVTPGNKRYQPKPAKESYSRCTFHVRHFALYSKQLSLGSEIGGSEVYKYTGLQGYETRNEATDWMFPLLIVTCLKRPSVS